MSVRTLHHSHDNGPLPPASVGDNGSRRDGPAALAPLQWLRNFQEPDDEIVHRLAVMFVDDPRFAGTFQRYHPAGPGFLRDAMFHSLGDRPPDWSPPDQVRGWSPSRATSPSATSPRHQTGS